MPLSRDARTDRRRRLIRDAFNAEVETAVVGKVRTRRSDSDSDDEVLPRRGAGYSQDVRRECQQRLVQLIPVRRRAYLSAIAISCLLPAILLIAHYAIFVYPSRWQTHPMALMLYASHPRSLCSWLSGQLWLMCLISTVLTFRLRRHKLDDYDGEYRLWFWLISTCLLGSLDSTSHVIELFGNSLDRWSQLNLGWSGNAVVQSTAATLIGMLGLRLCTELKVVPASLIFWLLGLVAWAGSAALSQAMLKIDLSPAFREWLRASLWIGGLTCVWLASLSYLRYVYIEAQRRFLLRGKLAASVSATWKERLVDSMPKMPAMPRIRLRPATEVDGEMEAKPTKRRSRNEAEETAQPEHSKRRFGWPTFRKRSSNPLTDVDSQAELPSTRTTPLAVPRNVAPINAPQSTAKVSQATPSNAVDETVKAKRTVPSGVDSRSSESEGKRSFMGRLFSRKSKSDDDAPEYRKVERQSSKVSGAEAEVADGENAPPQKTKRSWLPKPKLPSFSMPKLPKMGMPKLGVPKLKMPSLPKMKLPSLRLKPPNQTDAEESRPSSRSDDEQPIFKPLPGNRPFPSTNGPAQQAIDANGGRPLSKAERKRMKRIQDEQDQQRRAA